MTTKDIASTNSAITGSIANAVGNETYPDLVLTRYPDAFDERSGSKNNPNLNRWTNLKDYNMAEHVNALQDAIMAIQKTLGERVHMPANPTDAEGNPITDKNELLNISRTHTVKDRIDAMESYDWYADLDKRYGGPNWVYTKDAQINPTIQQHRHIGSKSGQLGMPEKIVLTEEVQGKLPKSNINLDKTTGLTGSDIYVTPTSPQKISDALSDKISETTGGVISKDATLHVKGRFQSRTRKEFDANNAGSTGSIQATDSKTMLNKALKATGTAATSFLNTELSDMYYGRYVAIVRLASSNTTSTSRVAKISAVHATTGTTLKSIELKGTDFESVGNYKTFFLVFDHEGATKLKVEKVSTSSSVEVKFDYTVIEPVHPAVFDR